LSLPFARAIAIPSGPHAQQVNFELCECREDVEEHLADRIVRVIHGPAERQSHASPRERVADRVRHRTREPIELRYHERVPFAHGG
jgi:hypothetical protein